MLLAPKQQMGVLILVLAGEVGIIFIPGLEIMVIYQMNKIQLILLQEHTLLQQLTKMTVALHKL